MAPIELFISTLLVNSQPLFAFLGLAGAVVEVQLLVLSAIAITAIALLGLSVYAITKMLGNSEDVEKPVGPEDLPDPDILEENIKQPSASAKPAAKKTNILTHELAIQKVTTLNKKIEILQKEQSDLSKIQSTSENKLRLLQVNLACIQASSDRLEMNAQAVKLALSEYEQVYGTRLASDPNVFEHRAKLETIVQTVQDRVDKSAKWRADSIAQAQQALDSFKDQTIGSKSKKKKG